MKAKTMALSAIICAASVFGFNVTAAFAEPMTYELQAAEFSGVETQELSQAVRNRNTIIGVIAAGAAIAAISNHNKKHSDSYHDDDRGGDYHRDRGSSGRRNAPPPPPMPSRR